MQRVMIVGGPGSGKSTLARRLGEITGLPVYHMDHIHYASGWVERAPEAKSAMAREVHAREAWIFEGGHSRTHAERVARADTFIWLDVPIGLRLWRVLRRSWRYRGRTRPDMADGCPERFDRSTLTFLRFVWRIRKTSRAKLAAIHAAPPAHLTVHRLDGAVAVERFLDEIAPAARPTSHRRAPPC